MLVLCQGVNPGFKFHLEFVTMITKAGCLLHLTQHKRTVFYTKNLPGRREQMEPVQFECVISAAAGMKQWWQEGQLRRTCSPGHR